MSQNMTKKVFYILWIPFLLAIAGCFGTEEGEPELMPERVVAYALYPNDVAANDSAASYVANGMQLLVHPKVSYSLSFEKDTAFVEYPTLQLFRLGSKIDDNKVKAKFVRAIKPREEKGRLVYDFRCEENAQNVWVSTLVLDGEYYKGTTRRPILEANGPYSDTLSLNLIVTGRVDFYEDGMDVNRFAKLLLENFRKYYTSIVIDTLYVRYAHEHPTLGGKYPADVPWIAGRSSGDYFVSELGGWPEAGLKNALDIVLVHRIEMEWVLGYSLMYSGNLYGGPGSTVVIGAYNKTPSGESGLPSASMISTAIHETGHFFGLRHTTATQADFEVDSDFSNYEDGFTDTPYCADLLKSGLLKRNIGPASDFVLPLAHITYATSDNEFNVDQCPDSRNMMFPAVNDEGMDGFTAQQLAHVRKNLMVFPH